MTKEAAKLPVLAILKQSVILPFQRWKIILLVIWPYLLIILTPFVIINLFPQLISLLPVEQDIVYYLGPIISEFLLYFIVAIMAIRCHRVFLLPAETKKKEITRFHWLSCEIKYFFYAVIVFLFSMLGFIPSFVLSIVAPSLSNDWVVNVLSLPFIYILSRLSLVLPDIALGKKPSLFSAWENSRGQSLRLSAVMVVFLFAVYAPLLELARNLSVNIGSMLPVYLLVTIFSVFDVCALSLSYQWITENKQSNTTDSEVTS